MSERAGPEVRVPCLGREPGAQELAATPTHHLPEGRADRTRAAKKSPPAKAARPPFCPRWCRNSRNGCRALGRGSPTRRQRRGKKAEPTRTRPTAPIVPQGAEGRKAIPPRARQWRRNSPQSAEGSGNWKQPVRIRRGWGSSPNWLREKQRPRPPGKQEEPMVPRGKVPCFGETRDVPRLPSQRSVKGRLSGPPVSAVPSAGSVSFGYPERTHSSQPPENSRMFRYPASFKSSATSRLAPHPAPSQ